MHLITTLAIYLKLKYQRIRPFYNFIGAKIIEKGLKNFSAQILEGATCPKQKKNTKGKMISNALIYHLCLLGRFKFTSLFRTISITILKVVDKEKKKIGEIFFQNFDFLRPDRGVEVVKELNFRNCRRTLILVSNCS